MHKTLIILYFACFGCYILFSRQPDFFDGVKSPAIIHWMYDSGSSIPIPKAVFSNGVKNYAVDARYVLREWKDGNKAEVIYETDNPAQAVVYSFWGYWLTWGELTGSIIVLLILFQVAFAITKNPTPESLIEQLENKTEKKRRYKE